MSPRLETEMPGDHASGSALASLAETCGRDA